MTLFGEATIREAMVIKEELELFTSTTKQCINEKKIELIFFNTNMTTQRRIMRLLGWQIGKLSAKYLGVSMLFGAARMELWTYLILKRRHKMELWKHKWLSLLGKI